MSRSRLLVCLIWAACAGGCGGFVPLNRFRDADNLNRGLQAEVAQLKSVELSLRSRNTDLARRAGDAESRWRDQSGRIEQLERSVSSYQRERDEMARAFEDLRAEVERGARRAPNPRTAWEVDPAVRTAGALDATAEPPR